MACGRPGEQTTSGLTRTVGSCSWLVCRGCRASWCICIWNDWPWSAMRMKCGRAAAREFASPLLFCWSCTEHPPAIVKYAGNLCISKCNSGNECRWFIIQPHEKQNKYEHRMWMMILELRSYLFCYRKENASPLRFGLTGATDLVFFLGYYYYYYYYYYYLRGGATDLSAAADSALWASV